MKIVLVIISLFVFTNSSKKYHKVFYENGNKKAEGWIQNNKKTGYWYYYNINQQKKAEGHYVNDKKEKWWIFYNDKNEVIHKCQLKNGIKNGYCLMYKDGELSSAQKYNNGKKISEWFDFSSFKKENKLSDLR